MDQNIIDQIPDCTYLCIFSYLNSKDILNVSNVCKRWSRISRDEQLWKRRFRLDFHAGGSDQKQGSWLNEYKRFVDESACVPCKKLNGHKEHVLHVCFSRDGSMLATCSKDGTLKVWNTSDDWSLLHDKNLRQLLYWRHTLCSTFNENNRLLLVSGLRAGESTTVPQNGILGAGHNGAVGLGELAVFEFVKKPKKDTILDMNPLKPQLPEFNEELVFRCRAINEPFDVYGCWYDKESILNGQSRRFNQTSTMSDMYFLHAASEQTTSTRLFQFYNPTGGVVRSLFVSSYDRRSPPERQTDSKDKLLLFTTGRWMDTPHQIGVKLIRKERVTGPLEAATRKLKAIDTNASSSKNNAQKKEPPKPALKIETKQDNEKSKDQSASQIKEDEKPSTSTNDEKKAEKAKTPEPAAEKMKEEKVESSSEEESEDEENHSPMQQVQIRVHTFDRVDHVIELNGRIMGFTLSPDQRYVFLNIRPFVEDLHDEHFQPPSVYDHLEIRIIDLQTLTLIDEEFNGVPKLIDTSASSAFFIALDACEKYLLSGGDGSDAFLWDREHKCLIRSLNHENGRLVHTVAFHPVDPSTCVTASDDGNVVVWCSKAKERANKECIQKS